MSYVSEQPLHDAVNKATTDLFTFGYKHIVKPFFVFNHTPDVAHDQMIEFCRVTRNIPPLMWLLREMLDYTDPILETDVMGVHFDNPFGLSAGLDKNCDMPVLLDNAGFGFETVGSTTARPCAGNPKPWFHRLPEYDSMIVHVGLANDGGERVIPRAERAWDKAKSMQVSVSIARTNDKLCGDIDEGIEDYRTSMRRAAGHTAMIEINISCPNIACGGAAMGATPEAAAEVVRALRPHTKRPILVKLAPHDVADIARACEAEGADALTLINTIPGMAIDVRTYRSRLSRPTAGVSGPCIHPIAVRMVWEAAHAVKIPINGVGGVMTSEDAA